MMSDMIHEQPVELQAEELDLVAGGRTVNVTNLVQNNINVAPQVGVAVAVLSHGGASVANVGVSFQGNFGFV